MIKKIADEPITTDYIVGVAVGCIGLSMDDLRRLTISEFETVVKHWTNERQRQHREEWEGMRLLATIIIQPHVRRKIAAKKLLPLPWDKPDRPKLESTIMDKAEQRHRFEKLVSRIG